MEKLKLESFFNSTATNFKFKLGKDFEPFFDIIFEQVKNIPHQDIEIKFHQLWLTTSQEWYDQYGWAGYPSLACWLEILDKKPLTNLETEKQKKEHEARLRTFVATIIANITTPNLNNFFPSRYKSEGFSDLKPIIDRYYGVEEKLPRELIIKMAQDLRNQYLEDPVFFRKKMIAAARINQPLLLT